MSSLLPKFSIKTSHYIITGFGLVSALSWNTTIKDAVHTIIPAERDKLIANIIYSIIITLVLILIIHILPDTSMELPIEVREKMKIEKFNPSFYL